MIDFTDATTAHQRLSNTERDSAVAALTEYATEGRLTDVEAAERADTARTAVTRGDLAPLFSDLPAQAPGSAQPSGATGQSHFADPGTDRPSDPERGYGSSSFSGWSRSSSGRMWGRAVVSLMPFLALALFFITGNLAGFSFAWLWFLLIPVAGIVVYGAGGFDHNDRDRDW